jgi:hypothetical protein
MSDMRGEDQADEPVRIVQSDAYYRRRARRDDRRNRMVIIVAATLGFGFLAWVIWATVTYVYTD